MARSLSPFGFQAGYPAPLSGLDPFATLHREMNRLFDDALHGWPSGSGNSTAMTAPRMNVSETDHDIRVEAELPGVSEKDVQLELTDDLLTIRGEKQAEREDKNKNYHIVERSFGSFARSIRLPFSPRPDQVKAEFNNGVLTVTLPKAAAQEKVHRIQVQPGSAGPSQTGTIQAQGSAGQGSAGQDGSGTSSEGSGDSTAKGGRDASSKAA